MQHQSVLLEQAVAALVTDPDGFYIDGTFGRGGHSRLILERLSPQGRLLVFDKDPDAIASAAALAKEDSRVSLHHDSFAVMETVITGANRRGEVSGVLLDLGVSSPQLDEARRGFSFNKDGPLDMRMNTADGMTAAGWLAQADEKSIADVLYHYGEERFSRRIARAIVEARTRGALQSTLQLAEIIKQAHPRWEKHKHPATRSFQAIRIFINRELDDLRQGLQAALEILAIGGRLVVISFHSLEDRMVKQFMQKEVKGGDFPVDLPVRQADLNPRLKILGKAIKADAGELSVNIRARSAVMRVAEKTA